MTAGTGSALPASLFGVAAACGILSGKCGEGSCVGKSYCSGGGCATRPLHEWVIDAVDGVVVMDYRDTPGQIVGQGQTQVQYAASVGKPVVVGLMLTSSTPTYTTFYEEGPTALETAMALTSYALDASPATQPGWTGFAVENYAGYVASMQQFWPAAMAQWLPCGPAAAMSELRWAQ